MTLIDVLLWTQRYNKWTGFGDPCPCCGAEGDWEDSWDGPMGWWHAVNPDGCGWSAGDSEPCGGWPHAPQYVEKENR